MVTWVGEGKVSGYDPITRRPKEGIYRLSTGGTVDVNGVLRMQYSHPDGWDHPTYWNQIKVEATFKFVQNDYTQNPGKVFSAAAFLASASSFPEGKIPKPSDIIALPDSELAIDRANHYFSGGPGESTFTFGWKGPAPANTKYWLLVIPTAMTKAQRNSPPSTKIDKILSQSNINVMGRCISLWTNRSPEKPVITSPPSGSIINPGDTFTITYEHNDPDSFTPDDPRRVNEDLAGVSFEYAPLPTEDEPNPEWRPFKMRNQYYDGEEGVVSANIVVDQTEAIEPETRLDLIKNKALPVLTGVRDEYSSSVPLGHASLPGGDWQIRVATADYGRPFGDLVWTENGKYKTGYTNFDIYPEANKSPWSDPIRVHIPVQTPAPVGLYPTSNIAITEGTPIRLQWQYRNTVQPPIEQAARVVQIRKVGDPEWVTVAQGDSGNHFFDLPPEFIAPPDPGPIEFEPNGDFETGDYEGWTVADGWDTTSISVTDQEAHSGTHSLEILDPVNGTGTKKVYAVPRGIGAVTLDFWAGARTDMSDGFIFFVAGWQDANGEFILDWDNPDHETYILQDVYLGGPTGGAVKWTRPGFEEDVSINNFPKVIKRPPGGETFTISSASGADSDPYILDNLYIDEVSVVGEFEFTPGDFTLRATTQYEWRVQVIDATNEKSPFSQPQRFWIVPGVASGEVRPLPSDTIDEATLGCGTHRVFVYRRGGIERVGEITNISQVEWGRVRDDISDAKIVVSGWDVDCGNLLAKLQTWAYELVIYRDNGYSNERVWEGPITLITYEQDSVTLQAKDVMAYAYRRILKQKMSDVGLNRTVVQRAVQVMQNALAPDDPNVLAYMRPIISQNDRKQFRSTPAYSRTAFEEVDDMAANAGLDYTTVGRSIIIWGTKNTIGTLPEFRDEHLGTAPIVSEYGMSMANRYAVSDGAGIWGEATRLDVSGNDPVYGLVEMLSSTWASDSEVDSGTMTQEGIESLRESFRGFAERSIEDRYPPPVIVRVPDNTTLNPDTVISIQHLVPGVRIPLRSTGTLREVAADQKLDSVRVSEIGGKETVSVVMSPFNADDETPIGEVEG